MDTNIFKFLSGLILTCFTYLFGGNEKLLFLAVVFIALDYVSGWTVAFYEGKLNSKIGKKGLATKTFFFIYILIGALIDLVGKELNFEFTPGLILACSWVIGQELISITENSARIPGLGDKIPPFIKDRIDILNSKTGGKKND